MHFLGCTTSEFRAEFNGVIRFGLLYVYKEFGGHNGIFGRSVKSSNAALLIAAMSSCMRSQ